MIKKSHWRNSKEFIELQLRMKRQITQIAYSPSPKRAATKNSNPKLIFLLCPNSPKKKQRRLENRFLNKVHDYLC
jgi:hypothetical protein